MSTITYERPLEPRDPLAARLLTSAPCVVTTPPKDTQDPIVLAILYEIADKLDTLASRAQPSTIDLRWLAASRPQLEKLYEALGTGEVRAEVNAGGRSEIRETAIPCVWWICHFDGNDQTRGQFIDITDIPEMLRADRQSIPVGLELLRELCAATPSEPVRDVCAGRGSR